MEIRSLEGYSVKNEANPALFLLINKVRDKGKCSYNKSIGRG